MIASSAAGTGQWFIVEAAPAEPQQFRLPHQRKVMGPVNHRFALSRPALVSAPDKKSFSRVSSPILAWKQCLHIDRRRRI